MTRAVLDDAVSRLVAAGVPSPDVDAEWLLAAVLDVERGALPMATVTEKQRRRFKDLVARRVRREPLQHILGTAAFRGVEVRVGPGVFTPRPETEVMVGWAVEQMAEHPEPVVVDLCTGSGAIALALASELPTARVHAVELTDEAFSYASSNLAGSGTDLRQGDIADSFTDLDGRCDLVVANPPYIPLTAWETVDVEVRTYDPAPALWSGEDGLDTLRVVERVSCRLLRRGGRVATEHADVQGAVALDLFRRAEAWVDVRDHRDLAGRDRFVTATRAS